MERSYRLRSYSETGSIGQVTRASTRAKREGSLTPSRMKTQSPKQSKKSPRNKKNLAHDETSSGNSDRFDWTATQSELHNTSVSEVLTANKMTPSINQTSDNSLPKLLAVAKDSTSAKATPPKIELSPRSKTNIKEMSTLDETSLSFSILSPERLLTEGSSNDSLSPNKTTCGGELTSDVEDKQQSKDMASVESETTKKDQNTKGMAAKPKPSELPQMGQTTDTATIILPGRDIMQQFIDDRLCVPQSPQLLNLKDQSKNSKEVNKNADTYKKKETQMDQQSLCVHRVISHMDTCEESGAASCDISSTSDVQTSDIHRTLSLDQADLVSSDCGGSHTRTDNCAYDVLEQKMLEMFGDHTYGKCTSQGMNDNSSQNLTSPLQGERLDVSFGVHSPNANILSDLLDHGKNTSISSEEIVTACQNNSKPESTTDEGVGCDVGTTTVKGNVESEEKTVALSPSEKSSLDANSSFLNATSPSKPSTSTPQNILETNLNDTTCEKEKSSTAKSVHKEKEEESGTRKKPSIQGKTPNGKSATAESSDEKSQVSFDMQIQQEIEIMSETTPNSLTENAEKECVSQGTKISCQNLEKSQVFLKDITSKSGSLGELEIPNRLSSSVSVANLLTYSLIREGKSSPERASTPHQVDSPVCELPSGRIRVRSFNTLRETVLEDSVPAKVANAAGGSEVPRTPNKGADVRESGIEALPQKRKFKSLKEIRSKEKGLRISSPRSIDSMPADDGSKVPRTPNKGADVRKSKIKALPQKRKLESLEVTRSKEKSFRISFPESRTTIKSSNSMAKRKKSNQSEAVSDVVESCAGTSTQGQLPTYSSSPRRTVRTAKVNRVEKSNNDATSEASAMEEVAEIGRLSSQYKITKLISAEVILISVDPSIDDLISQDSKDLLKGFCRDGCRKLTNFSSLWWKCGGPKEIPHSIYSPYCRHCVSSSERTAPSVIDFWFKAKFKRVEEGDTIQVIFSSVHGAKFLGCTKEDYTGKHDVRKNVHKNLLSRRDNKTPFNLKYIVVTIRNEEHLRAV